MAGTWPLNTSYIDGNVWAASDVNTQNTNINALGNVTVNAQTGTTYTLVLADALKVVSCSNAAAITLTVPTNASVAFPVGTQIIVYQAGAGQVTISGAGVTFRSNGTKLKLTGQYAVATLIKIGTDEWIVAGNVSA